MTGDLEVVLRGTYESRIEVSKRSLLGKLFLRCEWVRGNGVTVSDWQGPQVE